MDPPNEIEERIEDAMREYADPDSTMTVMELEDRIDRAFRMEYMFDELLTEEELYMPADGSGTAQIFGKEIEQGESIQFDDVWGNVDPLEIDPDPWNQDDSVCWWCERIKDWFMGTEPWVDDDVMVVQGDVEFERPN
jgi:hypothetical protein